jgi:hypothetical protein
MYLAATPPQPDALFLDPAVVPPPPCRTCSIEVLCIPWVCQGP